MRSFRVVLIAAVTMVLAAVGSVDQSWAMSPRYQMYGLARVTEVITPNLIRISFNKSGRTAKVRLLGVGTPRHWNRVKKLDRRLVSHIRDNDIWEKSGAYVRSMLENKVVQVWTRKWNRYDEKRRLLVYLHNQGSKDRSSDLNAEIIRNGMGFVARDYVHVTFAKYSRLEAQARADRIGIWQGLSRQRLSSLAR